MNKIRKFIKQVLPVFLFGIILSIPNINVKALTTDSFYFDWIDPKIYVNKYKDGVERSERIQVYHRRSDGAIGYCIEPGVDFSDTALMTGYDTNQAAMANMSNDTWKRVNLIAYYGYGYGNHTDIKWYAITQYEIWKANSLGWTTYWADSFHGNNISQFEAESAELLNLVNNHYKTPSFSNTTTTEVVGERIKLTDTNGVLNNYNVSTNGNATISKSGNDLYITPNEVGTITINLTKRSTRVGRAPIAYVLAGAQNLLTAGNLDDVTSSFKINSIGGKVTINKVDKDTKLSTAQGDATLKGATYGIYKENGTKVSSITTNENGTVTSGMLPAQGRYWLQEESASKGYELDTDNRYYFVITKDNLYPTVTVYEKIIERDVTFFKVFATNKTGFLTGEPGVSFDIYLKSKNKKVTTVTTDEKGFASVVLPYGTYIVKQVTSTLNYEKVNDYEITIDENTDNPYYQLLSNAEITAKLKVIKTDLESGKVIKMSGIKFKIYDLQKNEYICQNITYPTSKKVCVFETNDDGEFITPYALNSGKYRLEEVDQVIDGYLWNSETLEFEIGENSTLIQDDDFGIMLLVEFSNKQVKGNIKINKTGEKLIIENGSYHYEKINLDGVEFEVYADEDIITKDGVKHYNKNELITTITTDKDGIAILEDLYLGKYYLKEIKSSHDNLVNNEIYNFELKYKDQYTEIISIEKNIKNKLPKGTLEFTKTDVSTGKPLPNTKIQIYTTDDVLIFEGVTDNNGKIIINDLPVNKYYLVESEAPNGYKINLERQYFEIKENGEIVKATLADELIIDIPNTSKNEFNNNALIALGFILGFGALIYAKNKNIKK